MFEETLSQLVQDPRLKTLKTVESKWPWPILKGSGDTAVSTWTTLREYSEKLGFWPLIQGQSGAFKLFDGDVIPDSEAVKRTLERAQTLDLDLWQTAILAADVNPAFDAFDPEDIDDEFAAFFTPEAMKPNHQITVQRDMLNSQPYAEVDFALIPTPICWQVVAHLSFGSWNACPSPEIHVRLMFEWYRDYGAEIVGLDGSVLEMRVARPPKSKAEAEALARQQYAYCPDIVDQGVQTVENLALTLVDSTVWYFWWD